MWVSKSEWERMKERIGELERAVKQPPETFTVYDPVSYEAAQRCGIYGYPWHMIDKQEVTLKAAITKILDHLGLKLTYVKGTPTTVDLEKVKR